LGLAVEDTVSPWVLAKVLHAGTSAISFTAAAHDLTRLADLSISDERVRRACQRIGSERIEHQQRMQLTFEDKPLPEQAHAHPEGIEPPEIACVMCDGGRYQLLDLSSWIGASRGNLVARRGKENTGKRVVSDYCWA
jgi:hypothetical protein